MYIKCVPAKRIKARANLTVDPDIYRESMRVFATLDMSMSGFLEQQLALFLQMIAPLRPVMEQVELGKVDPAELKAAMRAFSASGNMVVGEQLAQFGQAQRQIAEFTEGVHTDKKAKK